jgi:hypothetical protein
MLITPSAVFTIFSATTANNCGKHRQKKAKSSSTDFELVVGDADIPAKPIHHQENTSERNRITSFSAFIDADNTKRSRYCEKERQIKTAKSSSAAY